MSYDIFLLYTGIQPTNVLKYWIIQTNKLITRHTTKCPNLHWNDTCDTTFSVIRFSVTEWANVCEGDNSILQWIMKNSHTLVTSHGKLHKQEK